MKRSDQIQKAAKKLYKNQNDENEAIEYFIEGAKWADKNDSIGRNELDKLFTKCDGDLDFLTFLLTEYFEK